MTEEEKQQEIGNLFENIMKENSNLVKEVDMQVQGAQSVPNTMEEKRLPRHIIIKMSKVKDKDGRGSVGEPVRGEGITKYK